MMQFHIHAQADEANAFGFETEALLETVFAGEQDFAAGSYDPLPGDGASAAVQGPSDLARVAGISGGVGDVAVGGDFAARDAADLSEEEFEEIVFFRRHGEQGTAMRGGRRVSHFRSARKPQDPSLRIRIGMRILRSG